MEAIVSPDHRHRVKRAAPTVENALLDHAEAGLRIPRRATGDSSMRKLACRQAGHGEHARLSGGAGGLLGRRDGVGRREDLPDMSPGFRAHGSNQRFHRLQRHTVLRPLSGPSLVGVSPATPGFSSLRGGGASAARDAVAQS